MTNQMEKMPEAEGSLEVNSKLCFAAVFNAGEVIVEDVVTRDRDSLSIHPY